MQIDTFQQGYARKTNTQEQSASVENTVNTIGFDTSACNYTPPPHPTPHPHRRGVEDPPWRQEARMPTTVLSALTFTITIIVTTIIINVINVIII